MSATTPPTRAAELRWALDNMATMVGRSLRLSSRNLDALLLAVILPVTLMLLFVYVFGGAINTGQAYINYVVPGIIILCAGFGASTTAVAVAHDLESGAMDRFRSLPIVSSAVLTGHVVASVARNVCAMTIIVAIAFAMGFRPTAGVLEWLAAVGTLILFMVAISWASAALGLLVRSVEAAGGVTFGVMFLPYVSSAFVPTETMPSWLHPVAEHQPVTPVIETVRGLLMGTPIGASAWLAVGWFAAITAISCTAAAMLFKRRTGN
ncbi:ABC transporter permease [Catellatospora sichuanensis]|uniref:ABC transporter permease n=1 Tax=Catellatospora sichuanensis TaxID=1969805 RepID=UPI001FEAC8BA|nr:ABC transporter permease [Catellatospora sichuanensis]